MSTYIHQPVLDWCNRIRAEHNMPPLDELPKGYQSSICYCPVARALSDHAGDVDVCGSSAYWLRTDTEVELPDHVRFFVNRFDQGAHPELIAGDA